MSIPSFHKDNKKLGVRYSNYASGIATSGWGSISIDVTPMSTVLLVFLGEFGDKLLIFPDKGDPAVRLATQEFTPKNRAAIFTHTPPLGATSMSYDRVDASTFNMKWYLIALEGTYYNGAIGNHIIQDLSNTSRCDAYIPLARENSVTLEFTHLSNPNNSAITGDDGQQLFEHYDIGADIDATFHIKEHGQPGDYEASYTYETTTEGVFCGIEILGETHQWSQDGRLLDISQAYNPKPIQQRYLDKYDKVAYNDLRNARKICFIGSDNTVDLSFWLGVAPNAEIHVIETTPSTITIPGITYHQVALNNKNSWESDIPNIAANSNAVFIDCLGLNKKMSENISHLWNVLPDTYSFIAFENVGMSLDNGMAKKLLEDGEDYDQRYRRPDISNGRGARDKVEEFTDEIVANIGDLTAGFRWMHEKKWFWFVKKMPVGTDEVV